MLKFKVQTDRGDFVIEGLNSNEARDQVEVAERGIEIHSITEIKDEPKKAKGKPSEQ